ncbi:carboxypeptidase-like regulatory domain-containing protein [Polaribacter filamentus]|nr:carboxypeptidase-like regulatory domain-containing protein [Polaribacter filamentus]
MKGTVIDNNGETLFGANIVVMHVPTGSVSGTTTQDNGKYTIPNLRVGGPYSITFSYLGYKEQVVNNIFLTLGKTAEVNGTLTDSGETLDEIIISSSKNKIFNKDRTGSQTSISAVQLKILPTI